MIQSALEYAFSRYYWWSVRVNGETYSFHKQSACVMLAFPLLLNLLTILLFVYFFTGNQPWSPNLTSVQLAVLGCICAGLVLVSLEIYFGSSERYRAVLKRYENENPIDAKRGTISVAVYTIGSFVVFGATGYLAMHILG